MCKFIEKARLKHGRKYNYNKVKYINAKTKIIIICPDHGEFEQIPSNHLSGAGCGKCSKVSQVKQLTKTTKQFIEEAKKVHNNVYTYPNTVYVNNCTKVAITCENHGDFHQTPAHHVSNKQGCPTCKTELLQKINLKTQEEFLQKANSVHNNFYDYTQTLYKGSHAKVNITCPFHGCFTQTAASHLNGNGCKFCALEKTGWTTKQKFKERCNKQGLLYIIECFNNEEHFYKIGITSRSIKERYSSSYHMPYNYKVVQEIVGDAGLIWDLEKLLHTYLKNSGLHYIPKVKFGGHLSECFVSQQNQTNPSLQIPLLLTQQ